MATLTLSASFHAWANQAKLTMYEIALFIYTAYFLFLNVQCHQQLENGQFENYSRIFKDAGRFSRATRCFSMIKDKTSFDSKLKDNSWRSRTSSNLNQEP